MGHCTDLFDQKPPCKISHLLFAFRCQVNPDDIKRHTHLYQLAIIVCLSYLEQPAAWQATMLTYFVLFSVTSLQIASVVARGLSIHKNFVTSK